MSLEEIIINKIKTQGPISFRDFMEMALYYPGLGYYTSNKERIGTNGDYYTSPVLSSLLGEMIGKQLEEMWALLGKKEFSVVEYGAGTGMLCQSILNYLEQQSPLYEKLNYYIIERNGAACDKERTFTHEKLSWHNTIDEIPVLCGCILSNELIDNFSVHKVVMWDELMEVFVDYNNGFMELLKPAPQSLKDYMSELKTDLPKGYCTEINLQAIDWLKEVASILKAGFVLTIDYGFTAAELFSAKRHLGTILCYHQQKINTYPYINIGEQDITSHVNFSALYQWGLKTGLECCGFSSQSHFLHALGLVNHLRNIETNKEDHNIANRNQLLNLYTFLVNMGTRLKVLIQHKGIGEARLSGMQFANCFVSN